MAVIWAVLVARQSLAGVPLTKVQPFGTASKDARPEELAQRIPGANEPAHCWPPSWSVVIPGLLSEGWGTPWPAVTVRATEVLLRESVRHAAWWSWRI